jgi:hypothetical protein
VRRMAICSGVRAFRGRPLESLIWPSRSQRDYNSWLEKSFDRLKLTALPCATIGLSFNSEVDLLEESRASDGDLLWSQGLSWTAVGILDLAVSLPAQVTQWQRPSTKGPDSRADRHPAHGSPHDNTDD